MNEMDAFEVALFGISGVLLIALIVAEQVMFKKRFKDANVWESRW